MTGLTAFLKSRFYPDYEFKVENVRGGHAGYADSYRRGREVDLQIRRWIDHGDSVEHPYAKKFVAWVLCKKFTPVAAQVAAGGSRLRTFIDAILRDRDGKLFVVEIKTGFHGYHDVSSGRMQREFAFLSNAPRNQHLLQAVFSEQLHAKHSATRIHGSFVLRINDAGVHVFYPPARLRAVASRIVLHF